MNITAIITAVCVIALCISNIRLRKKQQSLEQQIDNNYHAYQDLLSLVKDLIKATNMQEENVDKLANCVKTLKERQDTAIEKIGAVEKQFELQEAIRKHDRGLIDLLWTKVARLEVTNYGRTRDDRLPKKEA